MELQIFFFPKAESKSYKQKVSYLILKLDLL